MTGTPIADFLDRYAASGTARLHMPGHKGAADPLDITEIRGADSLYEADGIIRESEQNAAELFGSAASYYSCEGSSLCIRAMLRLVTQFRPEGTDPVILAARNVHKSFISAAALLDVDVRWLPPAEGIRSVCSLSADADALDSALSQPGFRPAAVYITSPDYLGGTADIAALAKICHRHGTRLAVDNAHGAYLRFLPESRHPLQLGADICCDSAHKTLPVLTGGAYLHLSASMPREAIERAKTALALFGTTSPSYLILRSLDLCNGTLAGDYRARLRDTVGKLDSLRAELLTAGVPVQPSDPLRVTIAAPEGRTGTEMADALRAAGGECEFADRDHLVLMLTPENPDRDYDIIRRALLPFRGKASPVRVPLTASLPERVTGIREAVLGDTEVIPSHSALGRVCAGPLVSCPPAVPVAMPGERIDENVLALLRYYWLERVEVLR